MARENPGDGAGKRQRRLPRRPRAQQPPDAVPAIAPGVSGRQEPAAGIAAASPSARRSRDRHGRGIRGPLAPPGIPIALSRQEAFEAAVLEAVQRVARRWAAQLDGVVFGVQEVPDLTDWPHEWVPLGRTYPGDETRSARILVYRRPIETRAKLSDEDLPTLIQEVVVEEVADLLGVDPEEIDPDHPDPG